MFCWPFQEYYADILKINSYHKTSKYFVIKVIDLQSTQLCMMGSSKLAET
jgi:hypothetical protein